MLKACDEYKLYQAAQSVAKIFEETNKRAEEISSRASAQRFRIEIDAKIKESIQKIDDKNTEMKSSFDERAFGEGYTVKNGYYRKKIVKDVSVFSVDTENVKVRMWKDFEANDPEVNLSLLEESVDAVSFSVIMTLVSAQLTDWENSIFGVSGVALTGDDKASTKTVSYIVGEFEKYAYGEQYKGELELGKGLVGAILLDFEKNSQKEKAGWEALDAPTWERKLWCSDTFPGPSIREFSTMVASIAATVCTFGAGAVLAVAVSAAVMAANELTFELADVGVGYHDWEEAAKNVAKAAVSGAISGASGAAMGAASKVGGIGGVFLKTGITSSSSITTQFTNAFIDGGFSGVKDAFNSWSDWQGIAFSTAGSFVTNGVGYSLANTNFTGFNSLQMSQINSIAGTVGGLTTNALEYAFTGQTSFNLLNLSMFGLEYGSMWGAQGTSTLSGGLFSMTIGQNGTHFAISSAGTDISLGTLYSNAMGIGHIVENSKIENYASDYGNPSAATTLRIQYGYGDKESNTLLDEILSGKTKLSLTSEKKDGATAQTTTDANGNKTVTLYGISANMSVEEMFKAGLVLQHEAHRNGIDDGEVGQKNETYEAAKAHTQMLSDIANDGLYSVIAAGIVSGDKNLQKDLTALLKGEDAFREYVDGNYDSSADYWLFKLDGSIVDDGTNYFSREVINESGEKVPEKIEGSEFTGSRVAALVNAIGIENAEKMLGINWNNSDLFNEITLKEVGLTDEQIKTVQHSGKFNVQLTDEQKLQLIGEALMAQNGGSWDSTNKQWDTGSLKIPGLENNDSLGVIRDAKTGKYTFFTAGLEFTREDNAFSVYDDGNGGYKDRKKVSYEDRDNTNVTFWMKNVFTGEYIANEPFENAFTSIDNTNNPRQTLISEYFKMYLVDSNAWRKDTYGVNQVGVFNGAQTMEGLILDILGKDRPEAKSTLYHPMSQFAGSENCFGPMSDCGVGHFNSTNPSDNLNGYTGAYYFQQQLNLYHSLGIYNGYQFNIHLKGKLR